MEKTLSYGYKKLQHWNQWLAQQFLGNSLLQAEQQILSQLVQNHFGNYAVVIGVPQQYEFLKTIKIPCHSLLSPLVQHEKDKNYIEADLHELPILTGSIDLVMLPHTLEFVDNARQLLAEACRIVKPEGLIAICGFNPYSAWGLRKAFTKHKTPPWSGNFIYSYKIKNWLQLVGFEMEKQQSILFRPPISRPELFQKLQFLEYIGSKCFPMLGGVYILLARAKVIPLIPIRMQWKQQLSGIRLPAKMPGHIARHSK